MKRSEANQASIESNGTNNGVVVANNSGIINLNCENVVRLPSLISGIVKAMANLEEPDMKGGNNIDLKPYKPEDKIEYNHIIKYKDIIKEYSGYYTYCNETMNIFDNSNLGSKRKILKLVYNWYLEAKGELIKKNQKAKMSDIEIIRANSDQLIDSVKDRIYDISIKYSADSSACVEDIELGVICFTCFCFMECKILEKPL